MTTKTCTKCKETKATTEFYKNSSSRTDGFRNDCKSCKDSDRKSWAKANPAHQAAMIGKRDALVRSADCIPEDFDLHATIPVYAERIRLTQETGVVHHVDHITPIAAGGLHEVTNLQVLTAQENIEKGATD